MSSLVYIPLEGERVLAQQSEYILTNYRLIQFDHGSRTSVSVPLHIIKEYKLTPKSAMFKVTNGIINLIGNLVRREEMRAALGLREYDGKSIGELRKICEVSGVPFVHPDHPYNRWVSVGFHRPFSRHFYQTFAWLKDEEIFTYIPDNFILTNYRLYQQDFKTGRLFMFPLHMVETFEARRNRLKIRATTGNFDIKARVPRQDHLVSLWKARMWDRLPKDHLDWLVRPFSYITPLHPLSQYEVSESATVTQSVVARETTHEMEASASSTSSGTVFVKPVIKDKCDNCGGPLTWEAIDWVGPDQYACPSCGASHRVEYVRM
ncbi:MAG: hypothetical protein ACTSV3_05065 [Candidatus Thorarchaeota archaeon]|nr:MAG: hypothetical protein DRO87_10190 [Candidatus Thorarchaeota archaeon]RLI57765.1 MAG: hypothetical protein DRP09_01630 [Candidatus Thorarchaeota archaeon]